MIKTIQVRWNGAPEDPETITQYGTVFPKGEWVSVPVADKDDNSPVAVEGRRNLDKFKGNRWFDVKGFDNVEPASSNDTAPVPGIARASVTTFKPVASVNGKGKTTGWIIEGKNAITGANVPGPKDEYADEASAQVVCDGLNQVAP